jgi:hypothetical protein
MTDQQIQDRSSYGCRIIAPVMLGRTVYRAAFKLLSHWDRTAIDCAKSLETLGMCVKAPPIAPEFSIMRQMVQKDANKVTQL